MTITPVIILSILVFAVISVYFAVWIRYETGSCKDGKADAKESKVLYILRIVLHGLAILSILIKCLINVFYVSGFGFAERIMDIDFLWYLPLILFAIYILIVYLEREINKD